jgi:hypothetical protein
MIRDLCHMGHLFEPDIDPETGQIYAAEVLIARAARKSMALALLARAEITQEEMNMVRRRDRGNGDTTDEGMGE